MCFYNDDYDWTAHTNEWTYRKAVEPLACSECGGEISPGDWHCEIFQAEYDSPDCCECETCCNAEMDEEEGVDREPCVAETWRGWQCKVCMKVLAAIYQVELEEGCPWHARQPGAGELWDEMSEHDGAPQYMARAVKTFPELAANGRVVDHLVPKVEVRHHWR